ncbi:hypothetical protein ACFVAJ_17225 [Agromyces sp. NPDC057679]|uniref:hypothetical protein n=1 Tax=Agromyces sp. NPDC057679 TaxID=3346207 RepID=UPI00366F2961
MDEVQERWIVIWFPPDVPKKERAFLSDGAARKFAQSDDVLDMAPMMVHRMTTIVVEERIVVPLFTREHDAREEAGRG